jgi:hypothetical protein
MSIASDFRAGPVAFLQENPFLIEQVRDLANVKNASAVRLFALRQFDANLSNKLNGKVYLLVYEETPEKGTTYQYSEMLRAFWCPYQNDNCLGVVLTQKADYMFTATMNGCSFGVGSRSQDNTRAVFQANNAKKSEGTDIQNQQAVVSGFAVMAQAQSDALKAKLGATANIIDVQTYGGGVMGKKLPMVGKVYALTNAGTLVGLRNSRAKDWEFYTLKHEKTRTTNYLHKGFDLYNNLI